MNIVTMDTATPEGCAALLSEGRCLAQGRLPAAPGQVATLPILVAGLLRQVGWSWSTVQLLVVTLGPGSFTGVRIALGFAKGITLAHRVPLVGVPTLEALAASHQAPEEGWVLALLDARRGELFASLHRYEGGQVASSPLVHCLPPQEIPALFAGETAGQQVTIRGVVPPQALQGWPAHWAMAVDQHPGIDPVVLAGMGQRLFQEQGGGGPLLEPLYVRPSEAEAKRNLLL